MPTWKPMSPALRSLGVRRTPTERAQPRTRSSTPAPPPHARESPRRPAGSEAQASMVPPMTSWYGRRTPISKTRPRPRYPGRPPESQRPFQATTSPRPAWTAPSCWRAAHPAPEAPRPSSPCSSMERHSPPMSIRTAGHLRRSSAALPMESAATSSSSYAMNWTPAPVRASRSRPTETPRLCRQTRAGGRTER